MNTFAMAAMITRGRFASKTGGTLLDAFAVTAYATSAWLTLTTLGGVWMFWSGRADIEPDLASLLGLNHMQVAGMGAIYTALPFVALALLAVPLMSVGAGAARLGAKRRSARLAAMRLVGVSARRIVLFSVIEALVLAGIGFVIGAVLYAVTLPAWGAVGFLGRHINPAQMILPWWGVVGALVLIALITVASTASGLVRVSISPLGVAKREIPRGVRAWRAVVLVVATVAFVYFTSNLSPLKATTTEWITAVGIIAVIFGAMTLAGSWFLQVMTLPVTKAGSPAHLIAARRIVSDARGSWRSISAIVLMTLVAAFVTSTVKFSLETQDTDAEKIINLDNILMHDISAGVYIAFAFALILGAVSTLIQQTSDVFDRAEESRALAAIGTPVSVLSRARIIQVMLPLVLLTLVAACVGLAPGFATGEINSGNLKLLGMMSGIGVLVTLAAALATIPIQRAVLVSGTRRND